MDILFTNHDSVSYMKEFTEAYRAAGDDIYKREADCLRVQLRNTMLPPREGDLLVGRKLEAPIGFLPQNGFNSCGYYCDVNTIRAMIDSGDFSAAEVADLEELLAFWKGRTTCEKVFARYDRAILEEITHENFSTTPGFGYPLYRMSGAQMDPEALLTLGIAGLEAKCRRNAAKNPAFYEGLLSVLALFREVILTYADTAAACALRRTDPTAARACREMETVLRNIAERPPVTFRETLQLTYLFYLLSGTYNYGRMDDYAGPSYVKDLQEGRITEATALALLTNLWDLMDERGTIWDARVILGGKGRKHPADADRFCALAMEASRVHRASCPQLTLRMSKDMDPALYDKALAVIGEGTTYPLLYNDDVNIPAVMSAFHVDEATAERYVPFGCGEYVLYGQSFGTPSGAINLLYGLRDCITGSRRARFESARTFEDFYAGYMEEVARMASLLARQEKLEYDVCGEDAPYYFFSLLFDDCLERGLPVFAGGIHYLGGTLETYGNINTADSLVALRDVIFEKQLLSKEALAAALEADFAGEEHAAVQTLLLAQPKYGNDLAACDDLAVRFHNDLCAIIEAQAAPAGLHTYLPVIINNSMNTTFGLTTGASPDGRNANTYMANANNPMNGRDQCGITAMLNSLLKLRPEHHAGSVQNLRFSGELFGPLLPKTRALLASYFDRGGTQAMISVLNRGDLEDAMEHPEKYPNLFVRVGGFSIRFIDLERSVQQELLTRTLY